MKRNCLLVIATLIVITAQSQLNIQSGATFFIQSGATVTVQGDITGSTDIQGPGLVLMKGSNAQNLTMSGFSIPNLQVDNTSNVTSPAQQEFPAHLHLPMEK